MLRCPVGFRNTIQKWSTTNLEAVCAVGHGDLARTIRRVFSYQQAMDHCFAASYFGAPSPIDWRDSPARASRRNVWKKRLVQARFWLAQKTVLKTVGKIWMSRNSSRVLVTSNGFHGSCLFDGEQHHYRLLLVVESLYHLLFINQTLCTIVNTTCLDITNYFNNGIRCNGQRKSFR